MSDTVKVAVTGAGGQIGYSLLFRIAAGEMLGSNQKISLQLLDLPTAQDTLKGVVMELEDCAFPLLESVSISDDPNISFKDAQICLLVGSRPRSKGMERSDLLSANGNIFTVQGKAIAENADENVKVLVVGNPANTNAYIAAQAAKKVGRTNPANYTAMLRLDHNRAIFQLSHKLGVSPVNIQKFCVWGNHSPTMYPDFTHSTINSQKVAPQIDNEWRDSFIENIGKRGAKIIEARGLSSAASAANAAIDHIRDWVFGKDDWVTMGVPSDGSYGIDEGIVFGFPCICKNGTYQIVKNLDIDQFSKEKISLTLEELKQERDVVSKLL